MPVIRCKNGLYKIENGKCIYKTKKKAEEAQKAIYTKRSKKNKRKKKKGF